MGAPEPDQLGENLEGLGFEMVFDGLDLLLDRVGTQAEQFEHFSESLVPHLDVVGHRAALVREREAAVFFVIHKTALRQAAHHVGDGGAAESERGREIGHPGVTLAGDQFLNPFQVVLGGFRPAGKRCRSFPRFWSHQMVS